VRSHAFQVANAQTPPPPFLLKSDGVWSLVFFFRLLCILYNSVKTTVGEGDVSKILYIESKRVNFVKYFKYFV
jgi:hypothetical protein